MRKLILFLLFTFIINEGYSQNGWFGIQTPFLSVRDFQFINSQTGYICGDYGNIARTSNGGQTWDMRIIADSTQIVMSVNFINENTGWAGTCKYIFMPLTNYHSFVYKTTNGGVNWILVSQVMGNIYTKDIKMLNKDSIIIASTGSTDFTSAGAIVSTFNSGTSFQPGVNESEYIFYSLQFINGNTGWVAASLISDTGPYQTRVYNTTNSGFSWNRVYRDSIQRKVVSDIYFINENTGYICGDLGRFAKTTNAGMNWFTSDFPSTFRASSLYFFNENTGYVAARNISTGDSTSLRRTTDGGASWSIMRNSVLGAIEKMDFVNNLTGWAIGSGDNGLRLMKTVTGGLTSVNPTGNIIPDRFSLSQNYPNPFNPTTKINYELPITNFVSLKVYDALGNEVQTLVNEKQNAGSYSVNFNASLYGFGLPSGIYFYKLVTEKYSETKKMILVK